MCLSYSNLASYPLDHQWMEVGCAVTWFYLLYNLFNTTGLLSEGLVEPASQTPTLHCTLSFWCSARQRAINIPLEIGVSYRQFGILLLEDDRGNLVDTIIHDERCNGVLNINLTILQKWLQGTGKPPTWSSLIEVLRDIELSVLANDIEKELHLRGWTEV